MRLRVVGRGILGDGEKRVIECTCILIISCEVEGKGARGSTMCNQEVSLGMGEADDGCGGGAGVGRGEGDHLRRRDVVGPGEGGEKENEAQHAEVHGL